MVDDAVYPAAYCLRHGLELLVKQMSIYVAHELEDPAHLGDWKAAASATLVSVQELLSVASQRANALATRRGDPPIDFHATTMGRPKCPT